MSLLMIIRDTVDYYAVDAKRMLRLLETVMKPEEIMVGMGPDFHSYIASTLAKSPEGRTRLKGLRVEYPDIFTNEMLWGVLRVTGRGRPGLTKEGFIEMEFGDWRPETESQENAVLRCVVKGNMELLEFLVGELGFTWNIEMLHFEDDRRPENVQLMYTEPRTEGTRACLDRLYGEPKNANS